jgi:hypothetical protein
VVLIFHSNLALLFGLHRAAQIRDLDSTIGMFLSSTFRTDAVPRRPRWTGASTLHWGRQTRGLWNGGPVARLSNSQ